MPCEGIFARSATPTTKRGRSWGQESSGTPGSRPTRQCERRCADGNRDGRSQSGVGWAWLGGGPAASWSWPIMQSEQATVGTVLPAGPPGAERAFPAGSAGSVQTWMEKMEGVRGEGQEAAAAAPAPTPTPTPNEDLNQIVIQRLPDLHLGSRELSQNPKFAKLLLLLTERMDKTGLSTTVKGDLEKARRELRREKQEWLSAELMQRILNEILMEYHVNRWENEVSSEDQQFFATLERCLLLGKCCRRVDTGERETDDSGVQLLGLQREHLQELLPEPRDLQAMRQRLVPEVEKRLRDKCFSVLCYYRPEYEGNSDVLKMVKCGAMPELLEADKQKQKSDRDRNRENQLAITKQTIAYLTVLHRCFGILRELIERHRLASQPELDAELLAYLRLKSKAMFTKLGLMKLELRHQLFNQDTVQAHTAIRALLVEELEVNEKSAEVLRGSLGLYQMLGEEFEGLASEYSRLLELLGNKQWALQEFTKTQS